MKKKLALIGYPVAHSKSELVHTEIAKLYGVEIKYELIETLDLRKSVNYLRNNKFAMFNITKPYKRQICAFLDNIQTCLNAVNTVIIEPEKKLIGYNTDGEGFCLGARLNDIDFKNKKILVLGAGGASESILSELIHYTDDISIYNRTLSTAKMVASLISEKIKVKERIEPIYDIIINATSIGMQGEDNLLVTDDLIKNSECVIDLIYNPVKTVLLQRAEKQGKKIMNGLSMLFYQAYLAQKILYNKEIDDAELIEAYKRVMENN